MVGRIIRAARLDPAVYNELERDLSASGQALLVVILASLATGIGNGIRLSMGGYPGQAVAGLITGLIMAVIGFAVFVTLVYYVGTKLFGGSATPGEILRTLGFAYTPQMLGFFAFVPVLGGLAVFIGTIWYWIAGVIAVREALDFDTGKALMTIIVSAIAVVVALAIVGIILRSTGPRVGGSRICLLIRDGSASSSAWPCGRCRRDRDRCGPHRASAAAPLPAALP